jgi:VIT1/CCC1 family predicted Fe2+/Mn2+ transporter
VPFALTAGLSALGVSRTVVLAGTAELLAGALSMGLGGFLAAQAERAAVRATRDTLRARVRGACAGEVGREVLAVLGPLGVSAALADALAAELLQAERAAGATEDAAADAADAAVHAPWCSAPCVGPGDERGERAHSDAGATAFLLRFGEGMEEIPARRMYVFGRPRPAPDSRVRRRYTSALTIGAGYLLGGLLPLLPYLAERRVRRALLYVCRRLPAARSRTLTRPRAERGADRRRPAAVRRGQGAGERRGAGAEGLRVRRGVDAACGRHRRRCCVRGRGCAGAGRLVTAPSCEGRLNVILLRLCQRVTVIRTSAILLKIRASWQVL